MNVSTFLSSSFDAMCADGRWMRVLWLRRKSIGLKWSQSTSFISWSIFCLLFIHSFIHLCIRWGELDLIFGADRVQIEWKPRKKKNEKNKTREIRAHIESHYILYDFTFGKRVGCEQWCIIAFALQFGFRVLTNDWPSMTNKTTDTFNLLSKRLMCSANIRCCVSMNERGEGVSRILDYIIIFDYLYTFASFFIDLLRRLFRIIGQWASIIMIAILIQSISQNNNRKIRRKLIHVFLFVGRISLHISIDAGVVAVDNAHYSTFFLFASPISFCHCLSSSRYYSCDCSI